MRELVTIQKISKISPIPNADNIETALVRGWEVVVRKGDFMEGNNVLYFEIDSALPLDDPRFEFLRPRGSKTIEGREYHVLKTAKLRGQVSQGLVLPWSEITLEELLCEGSLAEVLGVIKYEPPVPIELLGRVKGTFPNVVSKTDAERVQNISDDAFSEFINNYEDWYATEKVDGTSVTYLVEPTGELRVCSRNWELDPEEGTIQVTAFYEHGLDYPGTIYQAELYGEGIQNNPLGIKGQRLAIFNVFDYDGITAVKTPRIDWPLEALDSAAPVIALPFPASQKEAVEQVDGLMSKINPSKRAEGIVWHNNKTCFKAINNTYLLKKGSDR